MIVLDLEWNQPFGGRRMEEIIQIGAVRLARPGGPVVDAFNAHIRPSIYRKLSPVAKKLPESAQALTSELDFPTAYQAFLDWCGEDTLWAEWGAQDHGVLAANAAYWKLPAPPVTACIDLQAAFCRTLEIGLGRRIALEQAAEYCGLPLIYEFHNALHDALYAALSSAVRRTPSSPVRRSHRCRNVSSCSTAVRRVSCPAPCAASPGPWSRGIPRATCITVCSAVKITACSPCGCPWCTARTAAGRAAAWCRP